MTVNYSGVGSTQGRRDFINGSVDFAISEIPFQAAPEDGSAPERPAIGYAYMPIVAGGTSFMYNLKIGGKQVTNLRLSGDTITKIFTGAITSWDDPAIKADNPSLAMPARPIVPVIRSDGSGTTAQFTLWMSKQFSSLWQAFCAKIGRTSTCGFTSQYPIFGGAKAQRGSDGVSGYVSQNYGEGAITYVEYSYAKKSGFPVVKVLNNAGYYIEPTAQAVAVALLSREDQHRPGVTGLPDADPRRRLQQRRPPDVPAVQLLVHDRAHPGGRDLHRDQGADARDVRVVHDLRGPAAGGQPRLLAAADEPGAGGVRADQADPGRRPERGRPRAVPQPDVQAGRQPGEQPAGGDRAAAAACDKKGGTAQCTTGTGGAQAPTAVTAASGGGSAAAAPGSGGAGAAGAGVSDPATRER